MIELNLLLFISLLFYLEHVVVKEHVQLFVRVVDAQLLEAVGLKVFEPKDVQDADELSLLRP